MREEFIIAMAMAIIMESVKNEDSKKKMRRGAFKITKTIGMAYMMDPDFQALLRSMIIDMPTDTKVQ